MATELDGSTWMKYSISVWKDVRKTPDEKLLNHPAVYPVSLVERLLACYLHRPGFVLDPFLGSGSTLVAAFNKGHSGIGIELIQEYALDAFKRIRSRIAPDLYGDKLFKEYNNPPEARLITEPEKLTFPVDRQMFFVVRDNARNIRQYLEPETIDCVITSPPYWSILKRKRTSYTEKPIESYPEHPDNLASAPTYHQFLYGLEQIFAEIHPLLRSDATCIVNVMDLRCGNQFLPYHAHLISVMERLRYALQDIIIWDRSHEYNHLKPIGYPHKFIVNKVHEYLLVFKKKPI